MYYMWINKNLVHQVGDQTKVMLRIYPDYDFPPVSVSFEIINCISIGDGGFLNILF